MADKQSNFNLITSLSQPTFAVNKYQSNKTGMKLYHIDMSLPLVKLEICVQTKPYDDTGCPHTLEHLIFMGSRNYPQQGYLDYISAHHYCLGTNAATFRDMTTYELTTVNCRSLPTLLTVYLDHVFNPLLTSDCYLTEVHHISGETGDDAGVVYSEMQSTENQPDEILLFSVLRDLWSEKTPYYYEAGGRLESIRNELTLDKIKLFHQKYYIPQNVAIVICGGGININEIIDILNKFEKENFLQNINSLNISVENQINENQRKKTKLNTDKFPSISIKRASFDENMILSDVNLSINATSIDTTKLSTYITTTVDDGNESSCCDSELMVSHEDLSVPSSPKGLLQTIDVENSFSQRHMNEYKEIFYPVEDNEENLGQVAFGYRLESVYEIETYIALDVLLTTLFDDDISIFYKEFIQMPNVLCSSIDHNWLNYRERILTITFEGVEVDNLTIVADKYSSVLYSIINSHFDSQQLHTHIQRNIKKNIESHLNEIEDEPIDNIIDLCCLDHISELSLENSINTNCSEQRLDNFFQNKTYLENLIDRPIQYWHDLIKRYLLEWDSSRRTVILLKPNNELLIEQQEQDEQRIAKRLESFGKENLENLTAQLEQARSNNKKSSSQCALITLPLISYDGKQLKLPPIEYYSNDNSVHLFHSPTSHFINYTLHIPIKNLPHDLQIYFPLFAHLLFHTSIKYNNIELEKYKFCELVSRDILNYSVSLGQPSSSPIQSRYVKGHYNDTLIISMRSLYDLDIYKKTIDYFRYVIFGTIFNDYKIIIEECEKQMKELIDVLQDGKTVHQAYFNTLIHSRNSNNYYHQMNIFVQKKFLEKICKHRQKYQNDILSKLERIKIFVEKNLNDMHMTICGNMELVKNNWQIVEEFVNETKVKSQIQINDRPFNESQTKLNLPPTSPVTIVGSPHEESGYVMRWARLSIHQKDFVPLLVFANYLDMENGPLWTACRTNGYSYGVTFDFDFDTNLILLAINQCSQLNLAYSSALEALEHLIKNKTNIELQRLNAAKNLTVCMLTESIATLGRATSVCVHSFLHTYSIEKYKQLLDEVHSFEFTDDILIRMIEHYLLPIVNDNHASTLILVNSSKTKETQEYLVKQFGYKNVLLIKDIVKHLCH